jgi:hypothetical protein
MAVPLEGFSSVKLFIFDLRIEFHAFMSHALLAFAKCYLLNKGSFGKLVVPASTNSFVYSFFVST